LQSLCFSNLETKKQSKREKSPLAKQSNLKTEHNTTLASLGLLKSRQPKCNRERERERERESENGPVLAFDLRQEGKGIYIYIIIIWMGN
jgi:hypothetical protein